METRGLFKRIAAITMAALTIVTSSGVDVNLLTANANELTKQATENEVDENANKALQKKDAKVGAQAKLSFSTNEALKKAVDDAGFNIDVKTNEVKTAAIKYNQSLLTLGKDFTATAKRTSYTKNSSKYNYVFTVTVTGKGDYTGSTTRTGVTQVSDIKPATTKKKTKSSAAKKAPKNNAPKRDDSVDNTENTVNFIDGNWQCNFGQDTGSGQMPESIKSTSASSTVDHYASYFYYNKAITPDISSVKYNLDGKWIDLKKYTDYTTTWPNNGNDKIGAEAGQVVLTLNNGTETFLGKNKSKLQGNDQIGHTFRFSIRKSVTSEENKVYLIDTSKDPSDTSRNHYVTFDKNATPGSVPEGTDNTAFEYNGGFIKPSVGVEGEGIVANENSDADVVDYGQYANADTKARLTVTLPENLGKEKLTIYYTISKRDISKHTDKINVAQIGDQTYTGKEIRPDITVTDDDSKNSNGKKLNQYNDNDKSGDYTVTYANNTNAGTASVTIKGCNNYTGTITKNFTIKPKTVGANADGTLNDNDIKINVPDGVYAGGDEVKPIPEITYTPASGTAVKLTNNKDFTVTYENNRELADKNNADKKPTAIISFTGNYANSTTTASDGNKSDILIKEPFSITSGAINAAGNIVEVNGKQIKLEKTKDGKNPTEVDASADDYAVEYSPVAAELPDIQIIADRKTLTLDDDYTVEATPTWAGKSNSGNHTWPSVGLWNIKLTGKGNYAGDSTNGNLTVKIQVKRLPINSNKLTVDRAYFDSKGQSQADISYSNTVNGVTYTANSTLKKDTDFTISPANNKNAPASGSVKLTLTGKGNYSGTREDINTSNGVNLDTLSTANDARLRYTVYDPITGTVVQNTTTGGMPYYGKSILPHIEIQLRNDDNTTESGDSAKTNNGYIRLEEGADFSVTESSSMKLDNGHIRHFLTIKALENSSKVYGTSKAGTDGVYYDTYPYSFSADRQNASKAFQVSVGRISDFSKVTASDIKIDFDPSRTIDVSTTGTSTGDPRYTKEVVQGVQRIKVTKTVPDKETISWYLPSTTNETLTAGTDFTITNPAEDSSLKGGQIRVNAVEGSNFQSEFIYDLGKPDITGDDFYIAYNGKSDSETVKKVSEGVYDLGSLFTFQQNKAQIPRNIQIKQNSTGITLTPKSSGSTNYDYTVTYTNEDGSETYDPASEKEPAAASFGATGTYYIHLNANIEDTNNQTPTGTSTNVKAVYQGEITVMYKIVPKSGISAYFGKPLTVDYAGENTPQPRLATTEGGEQEDDRNNSGPTLYVYDGDKLLTYGTDYKVNEKSGTSYFKTPGKKTVTIVGLGDYTGVRFKSDEYTKTGQQGYYTVRANLNDFTNSASGQIFKVQIDGKDYDTKNDLQDGLKTLYWDGSSLKTADGTVLNTGTIKVWTTGTEAKALSPDDDYTISGLSNITVGNNKKIIIAGKAPNTGSIEITTTIKASRGGMHWNLTDSDEIILPYGPNYTLGKDELRLRSDATGSNVATLGSDDRVSISNAGTDSKEYSGENNQSATFNNAGTYTITIQGPDPSTESSVLTLKILYDLNDVTINYGNGPINGGNGSFDMGSYVYNGKAPIEKGKITVISEGKTLSEGQNGDYYIPEDVATNAGTSTLTLSTTDSSSYEFSNKSSSTTTISYTITQVNISNDLSIELDSNYVKTLTYNAASHKPTYGNFTVYYKKGTQNQLTLQNSDFDIIADADIDQGLDNGTYKSAGKHTFAISGKGNYTGQFQYKELEIKPFNLSSSGVTLQADDQVYTGSEVKPVSVKIKTPFSDTLTIGTDYSAARSGDSKNINVGAANVTITGLGNYTGSKDLTFYIKKLDLSMVKTNLPITDLVYKNASYNPKDFLEVYYPVVKDDKPYNMPLEYGVNYTASFQRAGQSAVERPRDAGSYIVTLMPVDDDNNTLVDRKGGNYVSKEGDFVIKPLSLSEHKNEFAVEDAQWTGKAVSPKVTHNGKEINQNEYTVSYENAIQPCGSLTDMQKYYDNFSEDELPVAHISGKGNYTGTVDLNFKIGHELKDVTVSQTDRIQYDGSAHPPVKGQNFTVSYNGRPVNVNAYNLANTSDTYTDAASYSVTLVADRSAGEFYGTKAFDFRISPNTGTIWGFSLDLDKDSNGDYVVEYQGATVTPAVNVYTLDSSGNQSTMDASAYTVEYANNNKAGTATVKVTPKNYSADRCANDNPLTFRILGADITGSQFRVKFTDGLTRRQYTGSSISPAVRVTMLGSRATVTLTQGTDFTVSYKNNTNAGKATATVTGIGSYTGTVNLDYAIWTSLTDKTTTITVPKQMYTGEPITELKGVTIKAGGNNLVLDTDYSLVISSSDSFRTKGTAAFTGKGDYYEGTRTINFDIGNDASMYNVIGVSATYVFDHQAHKPVPVVTDTEGTVYPVDSVSYASTSDGDSCINAGNVRMQIAITSHGQTVSIPYNYTIERRDINTATFTPIADVDYNGKAHTPNVRVTEGTRLLTGTQTTSDGSADYAVTYYNNIQPGKALVTVTGINNYTGVSNIYFNINVKEAPQMKVTAMPSGRLKVSWTKVNGVSGYRIFYSPQGGSQKQVNIGSSKKTTYLTGLTRGVLYTVGLQSYVRANGQNGYSSASVQQIATSTTQPKITSAKSTGKGKIKLTWKKVSNATAYMVYRKTSGSKKWTRVKTTKSTSFTNTGLKSGRKYTYKVISYKQSGVKRSFSKYSSGKTVKAK